MRAALIRSHQHCACHCHCPLTIVAQSYHTFMWETFFKHVDVLPENVCETLRSPLPARPRRSVSQNMRLLQVHILDGNAGNGQSEALQEECRRYSIDLTLRARLCFLMAAQV